MNERKEDKIGHWIRRFMQEYMVTVRNCSQRSGEANLPAIAPPPPKARVMANSPKSASLLPLNEAAAS